MKRRKFLQSSIAVTASTAATITPLIADSKHLVQKEVYEWREYEMQFGSDSGQLETSHPQSNNHF